MRVGKFYYALVITALLAGCGDRKTVVAGDPLSGEAVTMRSGDAIAPPPNMPDFAPLYPGARVEATMAGTSSNATARQRGAMVTFQTGAEPAKVAAFYRARLNTVGWTDRQEVDMNGAISLSAGAPDDDDRGVQITIAPAGDAPGSRVTLIYNLGEG